VALFIVYLERDCIHALEHGKPLKSDGDMGWGRAKKETALKKTGNINERDGTISL